MQKETVGLTHLPSAKHVVEALTLMLQEKIYLYIMIIGFCILLLLHLIILPAHILGMDIGFESFYNLDVNSVIFSLLLALFESLLFSMWLFLIKNNRKCKTAPAAGGMVIGLITPLLCCSPILPTILSFIAILFPSAISGIGIKTQYLVNVYQTELLIFALCLLIFATYQNAKFIATNYSVNI